MKEKLLKILSSFFSTIVVMVGCLLVIYFMQKTMSIVSFIVGCIGFLILGGSLKEWEKRFKTLFNVNDEEI